MKRLRGCLSLLLLALSIAVCLRLSYPWIRSAAARYLIDDQPPRRADAIVVLGGDGYGDRTLKGAALAQAGYAPYVVLSGPPRLVGDDAEMEAVFAGQHNYPDSMFHKVRLPVDAESTRTEARFLGAVLKSQGVHTILLVTSNYHTRRAAKLWRQENPWLTVTPVGSVDPYGYFTPDTWWKTRPGEKTFLYEWLKTLSVMLGI